MKRMLNALFLRRLRLALIAARVAFGDKIIDLATIVPNWRRGVWNWRRSRLIARARLIEVRIG